MNKIERLRAAIDNPQALAQEKREQWDAIQQQAPDLAKFLQDFTKVFGKPKFMQVKLGGKPL